MPLIKDSTLAELEKEIGKQTPNSDSGIPIDSLMPRPLPDELPPVNKFNPVELLPESIRDYVSDIANRQQCPIDFVGVTSVCSLSAVTGNKVVIRPKQNDDWEVVPTQWGGVIGRPSMMKTPAMKSGVSPLYRMEDERKQAYESAVNSYKAELAIREIEQKQVKDNARKLIKDDKRDQALQELEKFEASEERPPNRCRLIINDATVEKVGELLNENPNGLFLVRDEIAGLIAKLRGEDAQSERAFYLECFDGNGRFVYDRIGRGTIDIDNCTLSMLGGIQPSKLAPLVRGAVNGQEDDGLIQRFQLAVWPDDEKTWKWIDRAPDKDTLDRYRHVFEELDQLQAPQGTYLRFSLEAQPLFIEWMKELQTEARSGELHPAFESHLMKMPKTIAGLALLFELVDGGRQEVGPLATARALEWADYLRSHANRVYSLVSNAGVIGAKIILKRRPKLPKLFTSRDIQRKGWAGLTTHSDVQDAIDLLLEHRWIFAELIDTTEQGGRPSIRYTWNVRGV